MNERINKKVGTYGKILYILSDVLTDLSTQKTYDR